MRMPSATSAWRIWRTISSAPSVSEWKQMESLKVRGFTIGAIYAGAFSGDGQEDILAVGDDGFAVIRLGGERISLKQFAAWRTDQDRRVQHELIAGDVNSDGSINVQDLLAVVNNWGPCAQAPNFCPAEATGDGTVNVHDLLAVINHWGL